MICRPRNHIISYYMIKFHRNHTFRFIVLTDKYRRYMNSPMISHHYHQPKLKRSKKMTHIERGAGLTDTRPTLSC